MKPPLVLVVDDQAGVRRLVQEALRAEGLQVALAASGEAAVAAAAARPPDLVLLDLRLPGADGLATLARVRELAPAAPVLLITAAGPGGRWPGPWPLAPPLCSTNPSTFSAYATRFCACWPPARPAPYLGGAVRWPSPEASARTGRGVPGLDGNLCRAQLGEQTQWRLCCGYAFLPTMPIMAAGWWTAPGSWACTVTWPRSS